MSGIATQLAYFYTYHDNTQLFNSVLTAYRSVSQDYLQRVTGHYLAKTNRILTYHLPHPTPKKG